MNLSEASAITEEIRAMLGIEVGPRTYKIEKSIIKKFADVIDDPTLSKWFLGN